MRSAAIVVLAAAVLLSFVACDEGTVPPDNGEDGRTPLETLQAFRDALNGQDTTALGGLLNSDFRFYFDEDDVGTEINDYTIPTSWNRGVFLSAVEDTFGLTCSVMFSFDESDVGKPAKGDVEYETGDVDISFTVMLDLVNGFSVTGPLTFCFTLDSADGTDVWSLDNIRDFTSGGVLERMWSFGTILAYFYSADDTDGRMPAETLEALEESFNTRDIELFKDVLAPEIIFYFDPQDVGDDVGGYTIPETWGYDDLISAVGNMFDQAYSIDFTVSTGNVGEPDEGADEFFANNVQVRLLVMVDSMNGYLAQGFCDFRFVNAGIGDNDDWVISDWWDYTAVGGVQQSHMSVSLGMILASFK